MSLGTKIFSFIAVVLLIVLSLGVKGINFSIANFIIFVCGIYLFVVSVRTRENLWAVFFLIVIFLFNPLKNIFDLSYDIRRMIDFVTAVGIALFFYRYYDSYGKGSLFEKFVIKLLPKEIWVIEDWTKDKSKSLKRYVESDMNPDITVRNIITNKRFAIECKFRSRFWTDKSGITGISWKYSNHDFYKKYRQKESISVKVVFGLGGNPKSPARIFVVPLENLEEYRGKVIPAQYLEKFEKNLKVPLVFD